MTVIAKKFELSAVDGYRLEATQFGSEDNNTSNVIVFAGATGIQRDMYNRFASFLASEASSIVITFDYRTVGASIDTNFDASSSRLLDWAEYDLEAVLRHARTLADESSVRYVGHSIGAQVLGLAENCNYVDSALCFSGGHGYYKYYGERSEMLSKYWGELVPAEVSSHGFFEGSKYKSNDLAGNIALDLSKWCLSSDYLLDRDYKPIGKRLSRYHGRMQFVVASSDYVSPQIAVEKMAEMYSSADRSVQVLNPLDYGLEKIDHFGYFRLDALQDLWQEWAAILAA